MFGGNPVNGSEGTEKCSVILPVVVKCILLPGYTDMRKGVDYLAAIVLGKLSLDPFSRSLLPVLRKKP